MKAFEMQTVSVTAVPLTSAIFDSPITHEHANKAMVTVEGDAIRYRIDGTAPTSTIGILAYVGDIIILESFNEIRLFKAIRITTDAIITVDYS